MADIPNVNTRAPQRPSYVNQAADSAKTSGLTDKSVQLVKEVAALLGGRGVTVTMNNVQSTQETGTPTGATGVPVLDNPDSEKSLQANLEKLISYLQLDNQERQAEMAKDRIKVNQDSLETQHSDRTDKIKKSLDEMDKAAKLGLFGKIFGWLMAAVAVVTAVALSVATGGVATAAVVGAVIAVGAMTLSETGAMDKIVQGLSDLLEKAGMSKEAAAIVAQVAIAAVIVGASLGAGLAGGAGQVSQLTSSLGRAAQSLAQAAVPAIKVAMAALGIVSLGTSAGTAIQSYKAGKAQSAATETEKFLAVMRQRLEESDEELQDILKAIQGNTSEIATMLASQTDTESEIARNIGQMA